MPRPLSARRRKTVVFAPLRSLMGGAFAVAHETYAHSPHEHAIAGTYLALMCVPLGLALREMIKSRQEGACVRA